MAMIELSKLTSRYRDFDNVEEEEVWVKHYSSNHQILLVGEGDFSFSHCLATLFGSASNMCASSLDSYDGVVTKYKNARSNLETLNKLGDFLLHGVDATTLHLHPDLRCRRFDRVIYNFPHAGFHRKESDLCQIRKHRELVFGFFHGASRMLRADGEVHVSHKNTRPFCLWNLEELASRCFLVLTQCVEFKKSEYPGYENKRGDGSRCDEPFLLGKCSTFKFKFSRVSKELFAEKISGRKEKKHESKFLQTSANKQLILYDHVEGVVSQRPVSCDLSYYGDNSLRQIRDPLVQSRERVSDPLVQSRQRVFDPLVQSNQRVSYPLVQSRQRVSDPLFQSRQRVFDPLVQSRQRVSPLDLCYYQKCRYSQFEDVGFAPERNPVWFQDNSIHLDKLRYTERRSLLLHDLPFQTNHHRQEQFHESSNRLSAVPLDISNGVLQRMLTRTRLPHLYARESPERHHLLRQDFTVQANQEPFSERSNHFSRVSHGEIRETLTYTSFPHPYTGESQELTLTKQRNFNIQPQHHW